MSRSAIEHYLGEYDRLSSMPAEWTQAIRQAAMDTFRQTGFPTLRHEDWKYTDIRPITKRNFVKPAVGTNGFDQAYVDTVRFRQMDCHELVFINGNYSASLSHILHLPDGVILQPLTTALKENREMLAAYLEKPSYVQKNGFIALNTAFMSDGVCIYIPDNTIVDEPINLLFLSGNQAQPHGSHLRNLIILGKNAQATVIENYIGADSAEYFTNTLTDVETARGAALVHYKLQQESLKSYHIGNIYTNQHRDSRVESHSISLGGALVRNDIESSLDGEGAEIVMNGLYIANGRQHIDNHTCVNHTKPHTSSEENYRGVLDGHARGVFNGKVIVHKQAQKTDAHQSNANLVLSDNAEIDTKPELEIYADDVKCSHGATVGQLDEDMLFYLRSRAIDADTARSLLIFAFVEDVVSRIKFTPVRERLEATVVGKLPDTGLIREFIK